MSMLIDIVYNVVNVNASLSSPFPLHHSWCFSRHRMGSFLFILHSTPFNSLFLTHLSNIISTPTTLNSNSFSAPYLWQKISRLETILSQLGFQLICSRNISLKLNVYSLVFSNSFLKSMNPLSSCLPMLPLFYLTARNLGFIYDLSLTMSDNTFSSSKSFFLSIRIVLKSCLTFNNLFYLIYQGNWILS